jgi:hypothetical protein
MCGRVSVAGPCRGPGDGVQEQSSYGKWHWPDGFRRQHTVYGSAELGHPDLRGFGRLSRCVPTARPKYWSFKRASMRRPRGGTVKSLTGPALNLKPEDVWKSTVITALCNGSQLRSRRTQAVFTTWRDYSSLVIGFQETKGTPLG